MDDPYYTLDIALFEGQFRYFGQDPVQVRGKVHQSEERYSLTRADRTIEPVTHLHGTRIYVHMKPFVLIPDIRLTIGLYKEPLSDGSIGEVVSAHEQKHKEMVIGQAQAWYYPQGHLIVLWECFLDKHARDKPLLEDPNMKALWESFGRFLTERFPEATRITTPWHDPIFEDEEYREFLRRLSYEQAAKAAYGKSLAR